MKKILLLTLAACLLFTACAARAENTAEPVQYTEEELEIFFSGEWLEKDSQFTVVDVTKRIGDGWDVEISSPVSHGAWVIRATAAYDAGMEGLLYENGVKYDLIPDENGTQEKEAATGLWGVLRFTGTEEAPELGWLGTEELGEVYFERTELPAYRYTGEDPIEGAVSEMLAARGTHPPLLRVGVPDVFTQSGPTAQVKARYGLSGEHVCQAVLAAL